MKKSIIIVVTALIMLAGNVVSAQTLHPSLGLISIPVGSDPICAWTTYLDPDGTYNSSGLQVGDTATDFTLYEPNGTPHNLLADLQTGKPVLLIAGSYTCPVFRNKVATINNLITTYGSQVNIYVVYQNEAHPYPDVSPYHTFSNGIPSYPYSQHLTYGDRLNDISIMQADLSTTVNATILVDGPCNEWQMVYGPSPNNSTLILPSGIVYSKHGWFDKAPQFDIETDLINVLSTLDVNNSELSPLQLTVFPNPSSDGKIIFSLKEQKILEKPELTIHNAQGKIISTPSNLIFEVNENQFIFDSHSLPTGVYYYRLVSENKNTSGKLILNN